MGNNGSVTIKEAGMITGKSERTIYRYVRQGKLTCQTVSENGRQNVKVSKNDLSRLFNINIDKMSDSVRHTSDIMSDKMSESVRQNIITKDIMKEVIEEFFETKQFQLMKPLEEQALVRYGAISKENEFLKQQIETLLEENGIIREQMKALPGPIDEIATKLKNQEEQIISIQKENEDHLRTLEKQKDDIVKKLQDEMQLLRDQAEKEKMELANAWKKELEDARRPWWKKLF